MRAIGRARPFSSLLRLVGDDGASLAEYALLVGLIAVACVAAVTFFGSSVGASLSSSGSQMFKP